MEFDFLFWRIFKNGILLNFFIFKLLFVFGKRQESNFNKEKPQFGFDRP